MKLLSLPFHFGFINYSAFAGISATSTRCVTVPQVAFNTNFSATAVLDTYTTPSEIATPVTVSLSAKVTEFDISSPY